MMARRTRLAPAFKMVFWAVTGFTVLSIVGSIALMYAPPSPARDQVLEALLTTWKSGIGAIAGMWGGKLL